MLVVVVFLQLSSWQLERLEERRADNAIIEANAEAEPTPAPRLLTAGEPLPAEREWRPVTAAGRYDTEHELLVRYRQFDGEPGFNVLTPFVTDEGTALLINRGWIPRDSATATDLPDPPAPPSGHVQVTGRLRLSEDGDPDQVRPRTGQVRYIDVATIARSLPYPVYGGFAELTDHDPAGPADDAVRQLPPPTLDEGPHLSYAVQWVIFAIIAVVGVGFLAYDAVGGGTLRDRLRERELRRERARQHR